MDRRKSAAEARRALDRVLSPYRALTHHRPPRGWARAIRDAFGMTAGQLGARMGVTQPTIQKLERSEQEGTIQLGSLRRLAEALDCELVYVFVPRQRLEQTYEAAARDGCAPGAPGDQPLHGARRPGSRRPRGGRPPAAVHRDRTRSARSLGRAVLSDEDLHGGDDAATNLTPEERIGLIPTWMVSRDDLNRAERANIAAGLRWARRGRFDVLDPAGLFNLHRRMFGDVWRWAGKPRESEKNIGVADWWKVREHLHQLTGDVAAQVDAGARPADEIAVDFHHRMVSIHVFPNGNGRHARLSADLLAERLGRESFSWGQADLVHPSQTRAAYIAALKAADGFDLKPLVAFARS